MSPASILKQYYFPDTSIDIKPLGNGLINHTFLVLVDEKKFVLQQININVFKQPQAIAQNISLVSNFLEQHHPDYFFIRPVKAGNGDEMIGAADGTYWRLFPFVEGSHTIDVVQTENHAYEAAKQFGLFAKNLSHFPLEKLATTIPDFHNLNLRTQQFHSALQNGNKQRVQLAATAINELQNRMHLAQQFNERIINGQWKQRVMHHDTKISNVLFDANNKAICVIDPDTIMPGYFFSDAGDMMRTCLSPVSEEETDLSKIIVRDSFFKSIVQGYAEPMGDELTPQEQKDFVLAGKLMIYMQSLRFLTDFSNNDVYYGARYELHNYNRALNQIELLKRAEEKEEEWSRWLLEYFNL
ncbi:MAG: aminoglycoside phosphotransferase family protein [Chitinophagaceae bacterium]|nr:aminoglycoside phosphotransferase family protein [Chitinophagaceae bacterium]